MQRRYIVKDLLREVTQTLTQHNIERPSREAQLLFMAFFDKDELWLISNQKSEIEVDEAFFNWVERRSENEPFVP